MKKRFQQALSFAVAMFMLLSLFPTIAIAADTAEEAKIAQVSLGSSYSGAVTTSGDLYMWGNNAYGQLGNGSTESSNIPVKVMSGVESVELGVSTSTALTTDGVLYVWGYGNNSSTPVRTLENVKQMYVPHDPYSTWRVAAITKNDDLYVWGYNSSGEVGDGTTTTRSTPVKVLSGVSKVDFGVCHTAAITTNGDLYMWGNNGDYRLGDGTTTNRLTPTKVLSGIADVRLGTKNSAALTKTGTLYTWGDNYYGQIGMNNHTASSRKVPYAVLSDIKTIVYADSTTIAITNSNQLYAWGMCRFSSFGPSDYEYSPKLFLSGVSSFLSTGWLINGYILTGAGSLNYYNGSSLNSVLEDVSSVYTGRQGHYAALTKGGELYTWGSNSEGQLGIETNADSASPVKVSFPAQNAQDDNKTASFNGHTYQLFDAGIAWSAAKTECENLGGHLVTINSAEEQSFLIDFVKTSQKKNIWIGAYPENGNYKWITNEPFSYTNWASGEPNNVHNMQNAAMMYTQNASYPPGTWNDENENGRDWPGYYLSDFGYICEWGTEETFTPELRFGADRFSFGKDISGFVGDEIRALLVYSSQNESITSISITSSNPQIVEIGEIENGVGDYVSSSENEHKATVHLKLKSEGTATITIASREGVRLSITAYVAPVPQPTKSVAVFTTEKSLSVKTGEHMWLAFGIVDGDTGLVEENWRKMAIVVSDPTIIELSDYRETEYGYSIDVIGTKEGTTNLTVTDTESGVYSSIIISVYDEYIKTYSYSVESIEAFYPNNILEYNIETNIYNLNGLYINNYVCIPAFDKSEYQISFDVYNCRYYNGAVDIYDADGVWTGCEYIDRFSDITSLRDTGEQMYYLVSDLITGRIYTYEQASFSKKTHIDITIPQGGYFTISNNVAESPGTFFVNAFEILYDTTSDLFELATSKSTDSTAFNSFYKEATNSFAQNVIDARNSAMSGEVKKALMETALKSLTSKIKGIQKDLVYSEVTDYVVRGTGLFSGIAGLAENVLGTYEVKWKDLYQTATGIGESLFTKFAGPAGEALKEMFAITKGSNKLLMAMQMAHSLNNTYATFYTSFDEGYINPHGVIVNTNGNVDTDAVLQVFKVATDDTINVVLNGNDPLEEHELFNICFVKNDQLVQPCGMVEVQIPIPQGMKGSTCHVYRQEADKSWTILEAHIEGNYLVFQTNHFSLYSIVGEKDRLTVVSLPNKLSYHKEDELSTEGLTLELNGTLISSGFICYPTVFSEYGEQRITVQYGLTNTEFTVYVYENPDEHDWCVWTVTTEPTCTEKGVETRICSRCREIETRAIAALGHNYQAVVIAPTCASGGYTTYTCSRCGDSYFEAYIDALGHDFGDWKHDENSYPSTHYRSCSRCDTIETEACNFEDGVCKNCGFAEGTPNPAEPVYYLVGSMNDWIATEEFKLSASENEGEFILEDVELTAGTALKIKDDANNLWYPTGSGNNYIVEEAGTYNLSFYPAGTGLEGYYQGYFLLTRIGGAEPKPMTVYLVDENNQETAFVYAFCCNGYPAQNADWPGEAVEPFAKDRNDHNVYKLELDANLYDKLIFSNGTGWQTLDLAFVQDAETLELDYIVYFLNSNEANDQGHFRAWPSNDVDKLVSKTEASCTKTGELLLESLVTGQQHTEAIDALGHDYGEWTRIKAPSCIENGEKQRYCSRCDSYETQELAALGHNWGEWWTEQQPTCSEEGLQTRQCTRCAEVESSTINTIPHEYVDGVCIMCGEPAPGGEIYSGTCGGEGDGSNLTWNYNTETGALTIEGKGEMKNFTESTTPWYEWHVSIRSVSLPEGLSRIGDFAFYRCSSLTEIRIPKSVTDIGDRAFCRCSRMKAFVVEEGNMDFKNDVAGVLYNKNGSILICCPGAYSGDYIVPEEVKRFRAEAFADCASLKNLLIPENVWSIGDRAFWGCTGLLSFTVVESNEYFCNDEKGVLFTKDKTELLCFPCGYIGAYKIPDSVRRIAADSFYGCVGLSGVSFGKNLEVIENSAFEWCTGLEYVTTPDTASSLFIEPRAFAFCTALTDVELGNGVKSIGYQAFYGCIRLKSVTIPDSVKTIELRAFEDCGSLTTVIMLSPFVRAEDVSWMLFSSASMREITVYGYDRSDVQIGASRYGYKFIVLDYLLSDMCGDNLYWWLNTNNGVLTITGSGDMNWSWSPPWSDQSDIISAVYLTSDLTSIEFLAFDGCERLNDIVIPDNVSIIESCAFSNCTGLTNIILPASVKRICTRAFENCTSLEKVVVLNDDCDIGYLDTTLGVKGTTTIYGHKDSAAESYASRYGFNFKLICDTCGSDALSFSVSEIPTFIDEGILIISCSDCGLERKVLLPEINTSDYDYSLLTAASCTATGTGRYTWRNTSYGEIISFDVILDATGHSYEDTVTPPSCTEKGYTTYTCSRCGDSYVADETAALGHDWGEWCPIPMNFCTDPRIEDRTCNRCGASESRTLPPDGHTPGEPVKENAIAPTCEAAGGYDMVVYCSACGAEISREHTDLAATGHDWNEPEYVWADDYSTVTATRTCKNDASHVETETVNATSEVTKEATYEEEGEIVYTATFENTAFETQSQTVTTPKLEKPIPANPFVDVAEDAYYYNAVLWAVNHDPQITNGTSATTFGPDKTCTRGQVVTFLWRAKGCPEPTSTENPFTDVSENDYYYKAVLWAKETGVTSGTSATTFSPGKGCTRGQVVTFLWRAEGEPEPSSTANPFTDVPAGQYFTKAVLWAVENGITNGTGATSFSPDKTCTRGQIVTFLYRDLGR